MQLTNFIISPSENAKVLVDAALATWTSNEHARMLLVRLSSTSGSVVSLTEVEANALKEACERGKLRRLAEDVKNGYYQIIRCGSGGQLTKDKPKPGQVFSSVESVCRLA